MNEYYSSGAVRPEKSRARSSATVDPAPCVAEALRLMYNAGDWLNPRRRLHVETLIYFLAWHGCRQWLDSRFYADIQAEHRLYRAQVDQAINDAFELGLITMRPAGGTFVIELVAEDSDAPPAQAQPQPQHSNGDDSGRGRRRRNDHRHRVPFHERGRA